MVRRLAFSGPLEWESMLTYFRARAIPGVEYVADDAYRRTVTVEGRPGVLELVRGGEDHLLLRGGAAERARRIFSLDAPVDQPREALAGDAIVGPLIAKRPGLRVPGTWDPYEAGIRAIVGQQISVAGANTIIGRLVTHLGRPLPGELGQPGLTHAFPPAHVLAVADLTRLGMPRARATAIQSFARAVAAHDVRLDGTTTLDALTRAIAAIRGLGPWTAQYIALRLGEPDAFPATDLGLRRALRVVSPGETRPIEQVAARWSPWRATAAVHLWQAGRVTST